VLIPAHRLHSVILQEQESARLPPKPKDPLGRHVAWVWVLGEGDLHYSDPQGQARVAELSARDLQAYVNAFEQMCAEGYAPPVLREHAPNGEREGDVLALALVQDLPQAPGKTSLAAAVSLADPEASAKIASGRLKYVSPKLGSTTLTHSGQPISGILEVSLVSAPAQKLGTTHVLAGETTMDKDKTAPVKTQLAEFSAEQLAQLKALIAEGVAAAMAPKAEEKIEIKAEEPKMDEVKAEMGELRKKLAELQTAQQERDFAAWSAANPGVVTKLGETVARAVWADPKARVEVVAKLGETAAIPGGERPVGTSLGEAPVQPKGAPAKGSVEALLQEHITAHKGDAVKALKEAVEQAKKQVYGNNN